MNNSLIQYIKPALRHLVGLALVYVVVFGYFMTSALAIDTVAVIVVSVLTIVVSAIISLILAESRSQLNLKEFFVGSTIIPILFIVYVMIVNLPTAKERVDLIQWTEASAKLPKLDLDNAPLISYSTARKAAEKELTGNLGSQFEIGEIRRQVFNGRLVYVGFLQPSRFVLQWTGESAPGYVIVDSTTAQAKLVTEVNGKPVDIAYSPESFFHSNVQRKFWLHAPTARVANISPELRPDGTPVYVARVVKATFGGVVVDELKSLMVMDAKTGEIEDYSIEQAPAWIDRVWSEDMLRGQLDDALALVDGRFNFSKTNIRAVSSHDVVFDNGETMLIAGLTSVGRDSAITGMIKINMRTKHAEIFEINGALEEVAVDYALAPYREKNYVASSPIPAELAGRNTYVLSMTTGSGKIEAFGIVDIENPQLVGTGATLQAAYSKFVTALSMNQAVKLDSGTAMASQAVKGVVRRKSFDFASQNYALMLQDNPIIYMINPALSKEIALTEPGDAVTLNVSGSDSEAAVVQFDNEIL